MIVIIEWETTSYGYIHSKCGSFLLIPDRDNEGMYSVNDLRIGHHQRPSDKTLSKDEAIELCNKLIDQKIQITAPDILLFLSPIGVLCLIVYLIVTFGA